MKEVFDKGVRKRVNISLTAKGLVQPEITVETVNTDEIITLKNPNDIADIEKNDLVSEAFRILKEIEVKSKEKGMKMVYDE